MVYPNGNTRAPEIISTCPPMRLDDTCPSTTQVVDVARWSDEAGCTAILVFSDNSMLDPWVVAQIIIRYTKSICPLVAIQPIYMHPYTVAKQLVTLGLLYNRRVDLNMVAGGFKNDLVALNDTTAHDQRYERLVEYTTIVKHLVCSSDAFTFEGNHYSVKQLKLKAILPEEIRPRIFVSGSSEAGFGAAKALGATAVQYPGPAVEGGHVSHPHGVRTGIRVGVVARLQNEDAWNVAHQRFPVNRKGQVTRQLATKTSDSVWHRQLSSLAEHAEDNPYWLVPFENYKTMCPYLVGDYRTVGEELSKYMAMGHGTFILDVPGDAEELWHTRRALDYASQPR